MRVPEALQQHATSITSMLQHHSPGFLLGLRWPPTEQAKEACLLLPLVVRILRVAHDWTGSGVAGQPSMRSTPWQAWRMGSRGCTAETRPRWRSAQRLHG